MKFFIFFFPASSPGENVEMMPTTTNQVHDVVESMDNIVADNEGKNLTSKISEPSIESETSTENCATNTCPKTIQEVSEKIVTEGKSDIEKKDHVSDQTNNDYDNEGKL